MNLPEPRPCPTCKSTDVSVIYDVTKQTRDIKRRGIVVVPAGTKVSFEYNVKCCKCGLTLDHPYRTKFTAINVWNTTKHIALPGRALK